MTRRVDVDSLARWLKSIGIEVVNRDLDAHEQAAYQVEHQSAPGTFPQDLKGRDRQGRYTKEK